MKNLDFLLLRTECCNQHKNAPCRIALVGVKDSQICEEVEICIEPLEEDFDYLSSGMTYLQLKDKGDFKSHWPQIDEYLHKYPFVVATNDGYDAEVMYNAIVRHGVECSPFTYVTAKNMMRKSIPLASYSFSDLCVNYGIHCDSNQPQTIARVWTDILLKSYQGIESENPDVFFASHNIRPGHISSAEFDRCFLKREYKPKKRNREDLDESKFQPDHLFFGQNVVFTGKLEHFVRDEAERRVDEIGGIAQKNLSKTTNFLVVGKQDLSRVGPDGLSDKQRKAIKYKEEGCEIEIMTEAEFADVMGL